MVKVSDIKDNNDLIGFVYVNTSGIWKTSSAYCFSELLSRIAEHLRSQNPELSEEIEIAVTGFPVIHLEQLNDEQFRQFCQATHTAMVDMLARMTEDHRYSGYISVLSDGAVLEMILRRDPRSHLDLSGSSTVIINQEANWQAEEWIGEFIAMVLISLGVARQQTEWVKVLKLEWSTHRQINLSTLPELEFQIAAMSLRNSIHSLKNRCHASLDLDVFNQHTETLLQLLMSDARNQNTLLP